MSSSSKYLANSLPVQVNHKFGIKELCFVLKASKQFYTSPRQDNEELHMDCHFFHHGLRRSFSPGWRYTKNISKNIFTVGTIHLRDHQIFVIFYPSLEVTVAEKWCPRHVLEGKNSKTLGEAIKFNKICFSQQVSMVPS